MKEEKGIVKEVYLLDYDETLIGFKVKINDKIIDIIEKQNDDNANIYREDHVIIKTDCVNEKEILSIEIDKNE